MRTSEPSQHMRRLFRDDERHIWSTKPNKMAWYAATFIGTFLQVGFLAIWGIPFFGIFGYAFLDSFAPALRATIVDQVAANLLLVALVVPAVAFLFTSLLAVAVGYLRYNHHEYALTDDRVVSTSGLIGRDSSTVSLKDVRDVNVNVGILDKVFGTGNVQVQVAGGGASGLAFTYLDNPYDVLETIEDARKKAEKPDPTASD